MQDGIPYVLQDPIADCHLWILLMVYVRLSSIYDELAARVACRQYWVCAVAKHTAKYLRFTAVIRDCIPRPCFFHTTRLPAGLSAGF